MGADRQTSRLPARSDARLVKRRLPLLLPLPLLSILGVLAVCFSPLRPDTIVIGSKPFTESYVLA